MRGFLFTILIFLLLINIKILCIEKNTILKNKKLNDLYAESKCCNQNELLKKMRNGKYRCRKQDYPISYMHLNTYFPNDCSLGQYCMDEESPKYGRNKSYEKRLLKLRCPEDDAVVIKKSKKFRKCCPMDKVYNPVWHSCEESFGNFGKAFEFIKSLDAGSVSDSGNTSKLKDIGNSLNPIYIEYGLPECELAIKDILLQKLSDLVFYLNQYHSYDFCVDKTSGDPSANYVVRTCESKDTCKTKKGDGKIRCLWKCCRDGMGYSGGPKCKPIFRSGYDKNYRENGKFF